uniref:Uncharacterized protein n=1 Tax=Strongyloides stercoralis TaxID=6248 RepID=A0AAF5DHN3_STRER
MESTKFSEIPNNTSTLFKKYSSFTYDEKIKEFKQYLNTFSCYVVTKGYISIEDEDLESTYLRFCAEKDKIRTKIFLLGQFIDNIKLKELIYSSGMDGRKCYTLYRQVISFKEKFELLENAKLPDYQDVFNFVVFKLKNYFYDNIQSNFVVFEKIKTFIDEYISENKSDKNQINSLNEESKESMYAEINKKFYLILQFHRSDCFENPKSHKKSLITKDVTTCETVDQCSLTGKEIQCLITEEKEEQSLTRNNEQQCSLIEKQEQPQAAEKGEGSLSTNKKGKSLTLEKEIQCLITEEKVQNSTIERENQCFSTEKQEQFLATEKREEYSLKNKEEKASTTVEMEESLITNKEKEFSITEKEGDSLMTEKNENSSCDKKDYYKNDNECNSIFDNLNFVVSVVNQKIDEQIICYCLDKFIIVISISAVISTVKIELTKFSVLPNMSNPMFIKFSSLTYDGKLSKLKEYLGIYSSCVQKENYHRIHRNLSDSVYERLCVRKNKVERKIYLLGQLIDDTTIRDLVHSSNMNERERYKLLTNAKMFKRDFELLENARLPRYQDAFNYVASNMMPYIFEKRKNNFGLFKKINTFISQYISRMISDNEQVNSLDQQSIGLMYAAINRKFNSILHHRCFDIFGNSRSHNRLGTTNEVTTSRAVDQDCLTGNIVQSLVTERGTKRKRTRKEEEELPVGKRRFPTTRKGENSNDDVRNKNGSASNNIEFVVISSDED